MELDCESCFLPFDKVLRRPKLLPCGHTCCLACLLLRRGESADCTVTCSEDKQICSEDPNTLPTNLFIVSFLDSSPSSSDRTSRATIEDEPEVQALERLATIQQQKVDCLLQIQDELLEALKLHENGRKQELQSAQNYLALLEGPNWKQHMSEVAALLHKNLPLLGPRLDTVALSLRPAGPPSDKDDTWDSKELRLEDQPALQLAMLLLNKQGHLKYIHQPIQSSNKQDTNPELPVDVDVKKISTNPTRNFYNGQEKFEFFQKYPKVEVLRNMDCSVDKEWAITMLKMHKYHLRHLELLNAQREHLLLTDIDNMPQLKYLKAHAKDFSLWDDSELIFTRPKFRPDSYGLHWLEVDGLPMKTVSSLLDTHALTLKVLRLTVGTPTVADPGAEDNWPRILNSIWHLLKNPNLKMLSSLTLLRIDPYHNKEMCSVQLQDARNALPNTCTVVCDWCNENSNPDPS